MHETFKSPIVDNLRSKIIQRITWYHESGGKDFGALGMVKWLKNNLSSEEIDLLATLEEQAGEIEATAWLSDTLQRKTQTIGSIYDPNSLAGYTMVRAEEGWGAKGNFGIKIFIKDSERDKIDIPANRHGKKEKFNTDGDWMAVAEAVKVITIGIRGATERLKPDFAKKKAKEQEYYKGLFTEAGITPVYMQELPNGYCPDGGWCCLDKPWFKVTTPFGHIKIGWRKSVINIDWTESNIRPGGEELFPDEKVTRGGNYSNEEKFIHAHGNEKAVQYLKKLAEEAANPTPKKEAEE